MNAEGISVLITPEWLQATATGIPVLLLAVWILVGAGALWRGFIWRVWGQAIVETAARLGGQPTTLWTGFRVKAGTATVEYTGTVSGARTRVIVERPAGYVRIDAAGLLAPDEVMAALERLKARS